MSLVSELEKLQERKEALLKEAALIDRELESFAIALGLRPKKTAHQPHGMDARPPRKRAGNGETWTRIEFWLRAQTTAKTRREIKEGVMITQAAVDSCLMKYSSRLIHRGTRYGVSPTQFADHTADLEEQRHGDETPILSTSPVAPLLNGTTVMSSALTTTANTAPDATGQALSVSKG